MRSARSILFILFIVLLPPVAKAQYYDWGQDPYSTDWRVVRTSDVKYLFPAEYERQAVRLMHYMDTIRPHISYGFRHGPMRKMPLIMHTQNFQPNGLVMLAPRRMEFIVTPNASSPAMPWLKQLAAHEYRHAVQYNNLNRNFIRGLYYLLGEQGSFVGLAFMPIWALEGDAVMAETQMSTFGRGMQPSFTIEYRAMLMESKKKWHIDKYFSGSYRDYMPDHYQLGYQMVANTYRKYNENIWNQVTYYGSRYPYLFFTTKIALKKFYRTSVNDIFYETMDELGRFWNEQGLTDNSSEILETPITSYTTYRYPTPIDDHHIIALKTDLRRTTRLVKVDTRTAGESTLAYTGVVNTGIAVLDSVVYWTELRSSTFWEQRINSQLCTYDLRTGRKRTIPRERRVMFVASAGDDIATVEYNYDGSYSLCRKEWRLDLPDTLSVHGLAHDNITDSLYFIALSDGGMWIGSARSGDSGFTVRTRPGYTSIADLRAADGRLYFKSIATGKDEAHYLDLADGREYAVSESRYGSFSPTPFPDGRRVALTTYTPDGYLLAVDRTDTDNTYLQNPEIPENVVNIPNVKWDVPNLDQITVPDTIGLSVRKYRKGLNLFNFHSWAPLSYDADEIINDNEFNINLGVSLLSQNNLNSTFTQLNYYYGDKHSHVKGKIRYYGFAPKFEVEAHWSNRNQYIYRPGVDADGNRVPLPSKINDFFEVKASGFLPFMLSSGYHLRWLTPRIEYNFNNSKLFDAVDEKYFTGQHKTTFSLQFTDNVRMSHRDFLPRFGYAVRIAYTTDLVSDNFGKLFSGYVRGYLPGIGAHHSLTLRAAGQYQKSDMYLYRQKLLFPRGSNFDITPQRYGSAAVDYQFPVCYPDGGITSILYFKRIRANLYGDFARYRESYNYHNIYSYGLEVLLDISPFRLPGSTTATVSLNLYNPSDRKGVVVGAGFSLPL